MKSDLDVGLPLALRLRRAFFVALLLGLWAPFKILWEQDIARDQDVLKYRSVTITRHLRDDLGQGLTIGVLSGMRSVVADIVWLQVTAAWESEEWFRMGGYINLCTALQPRSVTFWDIGGWHLAWNASISSAHDLTIPNELRRIKASRFWVQRGLEIYLRGIENNPEHYRLWADTGLLYQQRLRDYSKAAYYYEQAVQRPDCPTFYERFPAIMDGLAGDDQAAYASWKALWLRLTPEERNLKEHTKARLELEIRRLEKKLSIPKEKRIFPN